MTQTRPHSPAARRAAGPPLSVLAEDWLTAKQAMQSAAQAAKGHSDRARRADLARWGRLIRSGSGAQVDQDATLDLEADLESLRARDLSTDRVVAAVIAAKAHWSDATVARMLSTLRGFTRWLTRQGLLGSDPCDTDLLHVSTVTVRRPRAVDADEVEAMLAAAAREPRPGQTMFWPARDVALVRFLARTGARAEEACGVTVAEIDRRPERPIWRVGRSKGGKQRDVPLPQVAIDDLDSWLAERAAEGGRPAAKSVPLFIRTDGSALTPRTLDRILRELATRGGVSLPAGAAAHAFRHHYGVTLSLRGVPQAVISQLMGHADPRTTSIYTTVAASALIGVLDDAGML